MSFEEVRLFEEVEEEGRVELSCVEAKGWEEKRMNIRKKVFSKSGELLYLMNAIEAFCHDRELFFIFFITRKER